MRWLHLAMLGLIGLLTGCDDGGLSNYARRENVYARDIVKLEKSGGGVPLEIHGLPWAGATVAELAGTLRMPNGVARGVRFRPTPPDKWSVGTDERLVLHFNPIGAPNSTADCRATAEIATRPPTGNGFTVNATYCRGREWVTHALLKANDVDADNWVAYFFEMQPLLGTLFPEK